MHSCSPHAPRVPAAGLPVTAGLPPAAGLPPIEAWHFCIGGFFQHAGRYSGIQKLWAALRGELHNGVVNVELCEWDRPWRSVAAFVDRFRPNAAPPLINVYAFSWGAGHGFVRLARELQRVDLRITTAVLSDPVYCPPFWSLLPLTLSPYRTVPVPANVGTVHYFRQRLERPYGHQPRAEDPDKTQLIDHGTYDVAHTAMDDLAPFHDLARHVAHRDTRGRLPHKYGSGPQTTTGGRQG